MKDGNIYDSEGNNECPKNNIIYCNRYSAWLSFYKQFDVLMEVTDCIQISYDSSVNKQCAFGRYLFGSRIFKMCT